MSGGPLPAPAPVAARGAPRSALLTAAAGMLVCLGFGRFSVGLLLPDMKRDLDLSYVLAGVLASANLGAYLVGVLLLPRLGRTVPFTRLLKTALVVAAAGLVLAAVPAPTWLAIAALALTGLSGALAWISSASLGATVGSAERRGRDLGLIGSAMGVGMVFAAALALALARPDGAGWRWVWGVQAAVSVVVLAAVLTLRGPAPVQRPARQPLPSLLGLRVAYGACGIGYALFATFFVASVSTPGGARGAALWAVVGSGAVVGALVAGHWSDRWGRRRVLIGAQLAAAFACVAVVVGGPGPSGAVVAGVLFGGLTTGLASLVPAALADALPASTVPDAFASLTIVFAVAQAVTPLAGGVVVEHAGFPVLFVAAAAAFLTSAASFGRAVRPRAHQASAPGAASDAGTGS